MPNAAFVGIHATHQRNRRRIRATAGKKPTPHPTELPGCGRLLSHRRMIAVLGVPASPYFRPPGRAALAARGHTRKMPWTLKRCRMRRLKRRKCSNSGAKICHLRAGRSRRRVSDAPAYSRFQDFQGSRGARASLHIVRRGCRVAIERWTTRSWSRVRRDQLATRASAFTADE